MSLLRPVVSTARPLGSCAQHRLSRMPLKARIQNAAVAGTRHYIQTTKIEELVKEQPGDEPDDVVFNSLYGLRTIELNRPKKLNSLNGSMARKIIGRLKEWESSDLANTIVIQGRGRAFCAGGDVAALANWNKEGKDGQKKSNEYFALEYKLDHMIARYKKPYIAYMDGITMGGGVGLSLHAPFRIATENTVFAMPETTIGFFPDVGGSFFLPRMDGEMGTYLALTSEQLKGVDVFYHGIATHYLHSSSLPELSERLAQLQFKDYAPMAERLELIDSTISEFTTALPAPRPSITGAQRKAIDEAFRVPPTGTVSIAEAPLQILKALQDVAGGHADESVRSWAEKTIKTIRERSPIAVAVTLQQMRLGSGWSIIQTFQAEHDIAAAFMAHPDFVEGVTARLIERKKERPNWQPNQLEDVTEDMVRGFFRKGLGGGLKLLDNLPGADYKEYPWKKLALPTEDEILEVAGRGKQTMMTEEVVQHFLKERKGKVGVREKVEEVLERHS
ncbi:uncharacterized protein PV09_08884 [Verruconis gallopava]|uniref:3-hydroxyisobutyryl-CoA hydrolase n=1 Tax=Verruconis gallopava TaxID=253628 RepID=A0A0D1ZZI6_9PEZI|nr:uncharacterized protein PV09_08884 [Verruconis gallopava]KIV99459.1 hypothetical protein PV09_08884 [Verruconis gallopava]